jgi:hypothetical protein
MLLAAGVGFVLWLPTIVDVLTNDPSNLALTAQWFRAADAGTHPFADGWWTVMGQFALPPEWLFRALGQEFYTGQPQQMFTKPVPWLLVVLVAGSIALVRRRPGDGGRLVATLAVTLGLSVAAIVRTVGPAFYYRLRWVWIPPMIGLIVVGWALWLVLTRRWPGLTRPLTMGALVVLGVVSAINVSTAATSGIPLQGDSDVMAAITPEVVDEIERDPDPGVVLVEDVFDNGAWYARGIVLELERRGIPVRVLADREPLFGEHRVLRDGEPVRARLIVGFDQVVERLRIETEYRVVADWTSVTRAEAARYLDLLEQFQSGGLDATNLYYNLTAMDLHSRSPATYFEVGVFVDDAYPTSG